MILPIFGADAQRMLDPHVVPYCRRDRLCVARFVETCAMEDMCQKIPLQRVTPAVGQGACLGRLAHTQQCSKRSSSRTGEQMASGAVIRLRLSVAQPTRSCLWCAASDAWVAPREVDIEWTVGTTSRNVSQRCACESSLISPGDNGYIQRPTDWRSPRRRSRNLVGEGFESESRRKSKGKSEILGGV